MGRVIVLKQPSRVVLEYLEMSPKYIYDKVHFSYIAAGYSHCVSVITWHPKTCLKSTTESLQLCPAYLKSYQ